MVLVTLEAQVPHEQEEALTRAFAHVMKHRPSAILQSMLTRDGQDPTLWRILTLWESQEALDAYYQANTVMPSAYGFHFAGLVPVAMSGAVVAYV